MKLYNTLSRQIEDFKPVNDKKVYFFVCGPTVYDLAQLGNSKTYIQMDILARVLKTSGYDVTYLQNITDVDDKIINRAAERDVAWDKLSKEYEGEYYKDMQWLGNTSVNIYARATDYIPQIIDQIKRLVDTGHAYVIEDDGIYFEIATYPEYGKLSKRSEVQEDDAQSRIDQSDKKRGWNDFAVWKFSKPGEPIWNAPFGDGRPGWHIEDTAITEHFFGPQYDIHGGAVDLIFPHHEAELTLMESLSGQIPFVSYWTHVGFLTVDGTRMGKSKGNFVTIREVADKGYAPDALRMFMAQSHYRSPINFTWDSLDSASNRLKHWQAVADLRYQLIDVDPGEGDSVELLVRSKSAVLKALQEDLNTPEALSEIDKTLGMLEQGVEKYAATYFTDFLELIDNVLGLNLTKSTDITDKQKAYIRQREEARSSKDWAKSDELRDQLLSQKIGLRDTQHGPHWYRV